jgi:hypothetical protein
MKRIDFLVIAGAIMVFAPFFIFEDVYAGFEFFTKKHALIAAFFKFAILATFGESIALRIREGVYNRKGFGLLPRAVVWGFLGITIQAAFVIFASGTPTFVQSLGAKTSGTDLNAAGILTAFAISAAMNLIYAPLMMTLHKITDTHIIRHKGKLSAVVKRINFADILKNIDWQTHWHFVLKKTIPFFWIPAHTITFLLPPELRVLFAAFLGIILGLILAFAAEKNRR